MNVENTDIASKEKINYCVVPIFNSEMEKVQFMSIYNKNVFECKNKEAAEKKRIEMIAKTKKRGIRCDMRIVTKNK